MGPIKLLAISPPCIEPINRAVYRILATQFDIQVHLIIPSRRQFDGEIKNGSPEEGEPFVTTPLDPIGSHLRLQRLKGLAELIKKWCPSHVLVDADPASLLMRDV